MRIPLTSACWGAIALSVCLSFDSVHVRGDDGKAEEKKPESLDKKFRYPTLEEEPGGLIIGKESALIMATKDDFKKVVEFYQEAIGGKQSAKLDIVKPGTVVSLLSSAIYVIDDSADRPVQLRIFVQKREKYTVTVAVSRCKGENRTHISCVVQLNGE